MPSLFRLPIFKSQLSHKILFVPVSVAFTPFFSKCNMVVLYCKLLPMVDCKHTKIFCLCFRIILVFAAKFDMLDLDS